MDGMTINHIVSIDHGSYIMVFTRENHPLMAQEFRSVKHVSYLLRY